MLPSPPEVAVWWCEATWKVGRERALPQATNEAVQIEAARNEYEPFQLVLRAEIILSNVTVSVTDFVRQGDSPNGKIAATNVDVCIVEYVPVVQPSDSYCQPGNYPDPILPLTTTVDIWPGTNQPFWFTLYVPKDAPPGIYRGEVQFSSTSLSSSFTVPVQLRVFCFGLSDVTHTRTAYYVDVDRNGAAWHQLSTLEQKRYVWDLYMQNHRRHRVNPYSPHFYAQIAWTLTGTDFSVNFTDFDEAMQRYLDEFDFNAFGLFGHKCQPIPTSLGGFPAFSPEYRQLFSRLMDKIMNHLREMGWSDKAYCYLIDEPNLEKYPYLLEGGNALQECAPGLPRLATILSYPPDEIDPLLNGLVDIWVPLLPLAGNQRFLGRKIYGEEVWWYVCAGPASPYPNFYIDQPAVAHRIRFWMGEKYGIGGDLYYAVNQWTGRNPWTQTRTWDWSAANGDGTLVYPPTKEPPTEPVLAPPINSVRFELTREALEDLEYFWLSKELVSAREPELGSDHWLLAQARSARQNALGLITNLTSYSMRPGALYEARRGLAETIEPLYTGAPWFVRQPVSRGVSFGQTTSLYSEALGWPPPLYQWQRNGIELPGATNAALTITNIGEAELGDYTVVAWNELGRATSAVARVRGRWLESPQIVAEPRSAVKYEGDYAVFSVTAVSTNPCTYQWFKDGTPLDGPYSTNSVLLITNLSWQHNGYYTVLVSNAFGATTAGPARLVVLCDQQGKTVFPTASVWRYHDLGQGLGTNWVNLDFDDSSWSDGQAPLGFGTGRESTLICTGQVTTPTTVYFRCTFDGAALPQDATCFARLRCDDGAVVYLNGTEVFRYNLPEGIISFDTSALTPVEGTNQDTLVEFVIPTNLFMPGANLLAAEVHQCTNAAKPIAFWTLDESEPPWRDTIGGHDLTIICTNIVSCAGKVGGCVSNSASATSWLTTPNTVALQFGGPFTVGGWFAFGQQYGNDPATTCIQKEGEFRLYYTGTVTNRYRFRVGQTEVQDQTPGTVSGQWRFVVGWYDGTNAYIQVDNGPVYSAPAEPPDPTTNPVVLLKRSGTGGFAADEVFFYKRVLNAQERTALYTQGLRVVLSSMVEDLLFDLEIFAVAAQPPIFIDAPADLTVWEGQNAGFRLLAYSKTSVTYQWLFNGVPIDGATNSLLFLAAVRPEQSGLYSLVASNIGGAVTSAPACLTVLSLPRLGAHLGDGGALVLELPACIVASTVLTSTNLIDWEPVLTREAGAGPTNHVVEIVPTELQRYYRLRLDW